ncbi:flippase [Halofilum ochraceum]|uniref:flippase n=1 Tax=Halofilum ochraceum TaxID=1611323 RepID=UPI00082DF271|nr:flippase [Halofilum ochraceum]
MADRSNKSLSDWLLAHAKGSGLKAQLLRGAAGSAGILAGDRLIALLLSILLARLLGAEGFGVYAHAVAIMTLASVLAEAGVPTLLMREVAAARVRRDWPTVQGAVRRGSQLAVAAASIVALAGLGLLTIFSDRLQQPALLTLSLMLAMLPIAAAAKVVVFALRGLNRVLIGIAINSVVKKALVLVIVVTVFAIWPALREPHVAMLAELLGVLAVLTIGVVILSHSWSIEMGSAPPKHEDLKWLKSLPPFIVISGASVINAQIDLIMLGMLRTPEDVGVYRAVVHGATLVGLGLQVANPILSPRFAGMYASGEMRTLETLVRRATRVIFIVAIPVIGAFFIAGDSILATVFGVDFARGHTALAVLGVAQLINVATGPMGILLSMTGNEATNSKLLLAGAAVNIILNGVLIPIFGILGAAVATSCALVLRNCLQAWMAYRILGISIMGAARE